MSRTNVGIEIYVLRVQCAGTNESDIIITHIETCAEKVRQFCETCNVIGNACVDEVHTASEILIPPRTGHEFESGFCPEMKKRLSDEDVDLRSLHSKQWFVLRGDRQILIRNIQIIMTMKFFVNFSKHFCQICSHGW